MKHGPPAELQRALFVWVVSFLSVLFLPSILDDDGDAPAMAAAAAAAAGKLLKRIDLDRRARHIT